MNIITDKWIEDVWQKIQKKLSRVAVLRRNTIQYTTREGNTYDDKSTTQINWGTNGFWSAPANLKTA